MSEENITNNEITTVEVESISLMSKAQYLAQYGDSEQPLSKLCALDDLHTRVIDKTNHIRYDIKYDEIEIRGYATSQTTTVEFPQPIQEGTEYLSFGLVYLDSTSSSYPPYLKSWTKDAMGSIIGATFYSYSSLPFYWRVEGLIAETEENSTVS